MEVVDQKHGKRRRIDTGSELVSVIIPVHNEEVHLEECLASIEEQTYSGPLQVVMYDDMSTDTSFELMEKWKKRFSRQNIDVIVGRNDGSTGRGCGFAKNRAVELSTGTFLCFQDADDLMLPDRIKLQLAAARDHSTCIVGAGFRRIPEDATARYTSWANRLSQEELWLYRFRDCTVIHPTWFVRRDVWAKVGGYDEAFPGCPEDLIFFYQHIDNGGTFYRVPKPLLLYRHHEASTCRGIHRLKLLEVRVAAWERQIGRTLDQFSIWSVGRDGKKFFNTLSKEAQEKVQCFGDINAGKIGTLYVNPVTGSKKVPIVHFEEMVKNCRPFVTCVTLDRYGKFEENIRRMIEKYDLKPDRDFYYFF